MENDFPAALKLNRIAYCANLLLHLRGRNDVNMAQIGTKLLPIISAYRQIKPEHLDQFYDLLQSTFKVFDRYAVLAEACMTSRQYQTQRKDQLDKLLIVIAELESKHNEPVLSGLSGMLRS